MRISSALLAPLALGALCSCVSESGSAQSPGQREFAWLSVKGRNIVASSASEGGERPFIPVGIGYCRNVIIKPQDEEVMRFCKERSLNTVRLSFYTRFFNNAAEKPIDIDAHLRDFCDPVVEAAKRNGLYVILDDHGYFSEKIDEAKARQAQGAKRWDDEGVAEWTRRWAKVAEHYKDEPNVLGYELCNEPHDIAPETARDWYTRCVKSIRQADKRHIVIVGTSDWSHARAMEKTWGPVAKTLDAPYNQVVFAFHEYPGDNDPWIVQKHIVGFRDKYDVPVLCTEFGATWWDKDETSCRKFQAGMLALFAKEDVGWMVWALSSLEDNPRNAHPPPRKPGEASKKDPMQRYDSCAYSDLWAPVARVMGSEFPKPKSGE